MYFFVHHNSLSLPLLLHSKHSVSLDHGLSCFLGYWPLTVHYSNSSAMMSPEWAFSHKPQIAPVLQCFIITLNSELHSIHSPQLPGTFFHCWQTTYSCLAIPCSPEPLYRFTSSFHFSRLSTWLTFIYLEHLSCFLGEVPFVSRYINLSAPGPTTLALTAISCVSNTILYAASRQIPVFSSLCCQCLK